MPLPFVKELANSHGISLSKAESIWDKAKEQAENSGRTDDYAYITGIFKNMLGDKEEMTVAAGAGVYPMPMKKREDELVQEAVELVSSGSSVVEALDWLLESTGLIWARPDYIARSVSAKALGGDWNTIVAADLEKGSSGRRYPDLDLINKIRHLANSVKPIQQDDKNISMFKGEIDGVDFVVYRNPEEAHIVAMKPILSLGTSVVHPLYK